MLELTGNSKIQQSSDVLYKEVTGEMVLLDLTREVYFGLDPVGSRVWQLIGEHDTFDSLLEGLMQEYDIDRETLVTDLSSLFSQLSEEGLISVS